MPTSYRYNVKNASNIWNNEKYLVQNWKNSEYMLEFWFNKNNYAVIFGLINPVEYNNILVFGNYKDVSFVITPQIKFSIKEQIKSYDLNVFDLNDVKNFSTMNLCIRRIINN